MSPPRSSPGPNFDRNESSTGSEAGPPTPDGAHADSAGVRAALVALKFYKAAISPLLPASCRFLPTCSEYSMQAYRRFGVCRGTALTAWRLARCNPWGGRGYDPPKWPPPGLEWAFGGEEGGSGGEGGGGG